MAKDADCGECTLAAASRRAFLRDLGAAAVTALALGMLPASSALAQSVVEMKPLAATRNLRRYALPSADAIQVDVANEVILARWQNRVYAFSTKCPHKGAELEWRSDEDRIYCPKHKARFARDGAHVSGRGTQPLSRYDLTLTGGAIAVNLDALRTADRDPAAWKAAFVALTPRGASDQGRTKLDP